MVIFNVIQTPQTFADLRADYLILVAMVLLTGATVGTWKYILLSGTGFHVWDLPKRTIEEQLVALHWNFAVQMLYHPRM